MLAREGKYDNTLFHRHIPGFMIQGGDPTGTGSGGSSYWGEDFRDEHALRNAHKHDARGLLSMANKGVSPQLPVLYYKTNSHIFRPQYQLLPILLHFPTDTSLEWQAYRVR